MSDSSVKVPLVTVAGKEVDCNLVNRGGVDYYQQRTEVVASALPTGAATAALQQTNALTDAQLRASSLTVHADISDEHLDAFGRLRTSQLQTLLDGQNHYGQAEQAAPQQHRRICPTVFRSTRLACLTC